MDFHEIWIEQCEAAEGIREGFGADKALGYLIGEKLIDFLEASDTRPEFVAEVPNFVARIKTIFSPEEIRFYLDGVKRLGPAGHVCSDEEFEELQAHEFFGSDPVRGAEEILLLARVRELLV